MICAIMNIRYRGHCYYIRIQKQNLIYSRMVFVMSKKIIDMSELHEWISNQNGSVMYDNIEYPNVISAFQAAKTFDMGMRREIWLTSWFGDVVEIGHSLNLRSDWHDVRVGIMYDLLRQKFSQDDYRKLLLSTMDAEIVYSHDMDDMLYDCDHEESFALFDKCTSETFWGVYDGTGENMLGKLIMRIRTELKNDL